LEILKGKELIGETGEAEEEDGYSVLEYAIESEEYTISEQIKLNAELSELLKYSGSWIQAGGSLLAAVAEQNDFFRTQNLVKDIEKQKMKKRKKKKKKKTTSASSGVTKKKTISAEYSEVRKKS
jgi:hypothetical protein